MNPLQPETEPGDATADQGQVLLDGPDGVAVSMTPDAARKTGERLIAAADELDRTREEADGKEG